VDDMSVCMAVVQQSLNGQYQSRMHALTYAPEGLGF
jgi:hypothetical protein